MSYPVYTVYSGDVLPIFFDSFDGGTGASITMTGLAVTDIEIYKDGSATQRASDAGYTLLDTDGIDFDGITGIHGFSIDTGDNTDAGFYAVGSWYHVVVSSVTIDGQTVNFIAAAFRIVAAESAAGIPIVQLSAAGIDAIMDEVVTSGHTEAGSIGKLIADNLNAPIGTVDTVVDAIKAKTDNLPADPADDSDIDSQLATIAGYLDTEIAAILAAVDTEVAAIKAKTDSLTFTVAGMVDANVVDWKGATAPAMTGDAYARLGAPAGASIAEDLVTIDNFVDDIESRITATRAGYLDVLADLLEAGRLDLLIDGIKAKTDNLPSDPADQSAVEVAITAAHSTTNGKIDAVDDFIDTEIAAILADTNELQTDLANGGRLDLLIDAIKAKTDSLTFTVAGVLDANATYWKGSVAPAMTGDAYARLGAPTGASVSADVASLDALIDILTTYVDTEVAAIKLKTDNLPANPAATGDIPSASSVADAVWDEAISGHVGAGTFGLKNQKAVPSETLSDYMADVSGLATAANLDIVDGLIDAIKATIDSYLDVAISSRLASASYVAPANTYISDIKAKTDNLPANPAAVGSAMTLDVAYDAAKSAASQASVDAIDDYVDTEVAAIKAKTDNLPASPAGTGDVPSAATIADAIWDELVSGHAGVGSFAKLLTDYLDAKVSEVGGGSLTAADIADAVLDEAAAGHTGVIATNLDAAVSTRLATTGYTAPSNSDITTIKTAIENVTYGLSALKTSLTSIQGYVDDLETRLTATRAGYLDNLATAPPTASEIDTELSSTHGAGAWGAASTGSSTYPSSDDPFLDNSGNPVEGVSVECYSSSDYSAGSLVQVVETDINGLWEFHLNPGTYYFRAVEEGYDWAVDGGDNEWSDTVT